MQFKLQNSVVVHFFPILITCTLLEEIGPKIKIVSLCWNFLPRLIQIYTIQLLHLRFLLLTGNTLFGQILPKNVKLIVKTDFYLSCLKLKIPGLGKFGPKNKFVSLNLNLVLRLILLWRIQWYCSFFQVWPEEFFFRKFLYCRRNQNCSLKLKFWT